MTPADLSRLAALVHVDDLPAITELSRRLAENRFRVLVVGEAKRGKSTLINALLGRQLLPVGVVPVTAVDTTVTQGAPERLEILFRDGRVDVLPLEQLGVYVDESRNPGNRLAVDRAIAYLDAAVLQEGRPGQGRLTTNHSTTGQVIPSATPKRATRAPPMIIRTDQIQRWASRMVARIQPSSPRASTVNTSTNQDGPGRASPTSSGPAAPTRLTTAATSIATPDSRTA